MSSIMPFTRGFLVIPVIAFAACSRATSTARLPVQPVIALGDTAAIRTLVARLDLERYKATIKGLTQFGDRRQGTDRNRSAVDWIEQQLKSYGCRNTARITYDYQPAPPTPRPTVRDSTLAQGGGRLRGIRNRTGVNNDSLKQQDPRLRALDTPPSVPGERQEVYCTKVGATHPDEM